MQLFPLLLGQLAVLEKLLEVVSMEVLDFEAFQWELQGGPGFLRQFVLAAEIQVLLDALLWGKILFLFNEVKHLFFIFI